ncbi:MAG: hypothetical protein ACOCYB_01465 [Alkalispirochaeta sp.]
MRTKKPDVFEAWVGGYVGPSYKVELSEDTVTYQVFEQGYEPYLTEEIVPDAAQWSQFLNDVAGSGVWEWRPRYKGTDSADGTTWYVAITAGTHSVTSRGLNHYPPGFVDFMRAVRRLLDGRQFS